MLHFSVKLCTRQHAIVQRPTCLFSSTNHGVMLIVSMNPRKESGHLDLRKVTTMCISADADTKLPETCSQFAQGLRQFDQNVLQNNTL